MNTIQHHRKRSKKKRKRKMNTKESKGRTDSNNPTGHNEAVLMAALSL